MSPGTIPIILTSAAAIRLAIGLAPMVDVRSILPSHEATISGCTVTDGDTIRCGGERIRLLGIDAPELPGHCRAGRHCAPGDPVAATDSLRAALTNNLHINRVGTDRYGRTLATVTSDGCDLSCFQLRSGNAVYREDWDNCGRVAQLCPEYSD